MWFTKGTFITDLVTKINVILHRKTYSNDFPLLNGILWICKLFKTACTILSVKRSIRSNDLVTSLLETPTRSNNLVTHLLKPSTHLNDFNGHLFAGNTNLFTQLGHLFPENINLFEQLGHSFTHYFSEEQLQHLQVNSLIKCQNSSKSDINNSWINKSSSSSPELSTLVLYTRYIPSHFQFHTEL